MSLFQILAGASILRSDVLSYWFGAFFFIVPFILVSYLARRCFYWKSTFSLFALMLVLNLYHFVFHGASICPHYDEFGYIIVVTILSALLAPVFWGKEIKKRFISLGFIVIVLLSLYLAEKGTFVDTYKVLFQGQEVFWSI